MNSLAWKIHSIFTIALISLQEAWRKKLVLVLFILSLLFLTFYLYGVFRLEDTLDIRAEQAGLDGRSTTGAANIPIMLTTTFGMYLIYFLSSLMSVLSCVGAISGDFESGVIQSILSRPISRSSFFLGRWLGFWLVNILYLLFLSTGILGGILLITGYFPPESAIAVGLLVLISSLLTSLTLLGSSLFSTLANGIGIFVLYGVGFAGGILNFIGQLSSTDVLIKLGGIANWLMPSNALWLGANYHLQSEILRQIPREFSANPFMGSGPAPMSMVLWAVGLSLLAMIFGVWRVNNKDA